jgi:hypothetical protein
MDTEYALADDLAGEFCRDDVKAARREFVIVATLSDERVRD